MYALDSIENRTRKNRGSELYIIQSSGSHFDFLKRNQCAKLISHKYSKFFYARNISVSSVFSFPTDIHKRRNRRLRLSFTRVGKEQGKKNKRTPHYFEHPTRLSPYCSAPLQIKILRESVGRPRIGSTDGRLTPWAGK